VKTAEMMMMITCCLTFELTIGTEHKKKKEEKEKEKEKSE